MVKAEPQPDDVPIFDEPNPTALDQAVVGTLPF
jgi:hypothetical protein